MYVYMYMYMYKLYKDAHNRIYTQTPTGSRNGLENHMHTQTDIIRVSVKDEIKMHTGCPALRTGNGGFKILHVHV